MNNKFQFRQSQIDLDIAGNIFTIDHASDELVEKVMAFGKEAVERANDMTSGSDEEVIDKLRATIVFCTDTIDVILGEGAAKKIFKGRAIRLIDAMDVLRYVTGEINAARATQLDEYAPNRAARRAPKPKTK